MLHSYSQAPAASLINKRLLVLSGVVNDCLLCKTNVLRHNHSSISQVVALALLFLASIVYLRISTYLI